MHFNHPSQWRRPLSSRYHGMLEVEYCNRPQLVSQKLQYMYRTHAANGSDEAPLSFVLDTTLTASSSANEEWKRRGGRPLESAESIVARLEGKKDLTVVERQELWLAKKNLKTETLKSIIAAQKLLERATTAPDLSQSRRTFRNVTNESKTPARKRSVASSGPDASSNQKTKRSRRLTSGPISNPWMVVVRGLASYFIRCASQRISSYKKKLE